MIRSCNICTMVTVVMGFALAGCGGNIAAKPETMTDLSAQIVLGDRPIDPPGACWASDETPAVIETITEQTAEVATENTDAGYRIETRQNIVQPRQQIWFRTPCADALTVDVITTLQRALTARGLLTADANGTMDPATRAAIRGYQGQRGLNSDRLSLTAAQDLGVIAADFELDATR